MLSTLKNFIKINNILSYNNILLLTVIELIILIVLWSTTNSTFLPTPLEILYAYKTLLSNGLIDHLLVSLKTNVIAMLYAITISLIIAYMIVFPIFRPILNIITKFRFLTLIGLTFFFTLWTKDSNDLKIALLVFGISVFLITSIIDVINNTPKNALLHARTLGMPEWRVVLETQFLGQLNQIIEVIRQNFAISWMMLTMVEGISRSEGGIGVMLLNGNKFFQLDEIFAIQILILIIGISQDMFIGTLKYIICPWSNLNIEKR